MSDALLHSENAPHHEFLLTTSKISNGRHVQRTRPKHGRRSYLSVGIGGDSSRTGAFAEQI